MLDGLLETIAKPAGRIGVRVALQVLLQLGSQSRDVHGQSPLAGTAR
jgi:hypothetical protein